MRDEILTRRLKSMLAEEAEQPLRWWWLVWSREGEVVGIAVIEARGMVGAVRETHRRGINPGGQVELMSITREELPPPEHRNRLLTPDELAALVPRREAAL